MPAPSGAFIAEKLDYISASLEKLSSKFDSFRENYATEHASDVAEIRRAHERLDRLEKEIAEFSKLMPFLRAQSFVITSLAIPFILAFVGFLWAIMTHKIQINL